MLQQSRKSSLKVLVLGFPRTGQTSLHQLLTNLHYKCYDDGTILRNMRRQIPLWNKAMDLHHDGAEWDAIFGDHTAALGLPTCLYWKELIECYPDCKIILLKRDRIQWYKSIFQTFGWFYPLVRLNIKILPNWILYKQYYNLTHLHVIGFNHYSYRKNKGSALRRYDEYNQDVMDHFEKNNMTDRLFVINFDADKKENEHSFNKLMEFLENKSNGKEEKMNGFPHKSKRSKFFAIYAGIFMFLMYDRGVLSRVGIQLDTY